MKSIQRVLLACVVASLCSVASGAEAPKKEGVYEAAQLSSSGRHGCSMRDVAGRWIFATSIGRQMLPNFPPEKDMTALGTMNIRKDGSLTGTFDVTVQDTFFMAGIPYEGSVVINRDCTGTLTFVTGVDSARTDTIAIVARGEMLAMSQDPFNLWTYQVRRIGSINRRFN